MEYCNGKDLRPKLLDSEVEFSEKEILQAIYQIIQGYMGLQKAGIIHRDLKPANILIHNKIYKIGDFGLAKFRDHFDENKK